MHLNYRVAEIIHSRHRDMHYRANSECSKYWRQMDDNQRYKFEINYFVTSVRARNVM